jgi:hypothetical protein
VYGQMWCSYLTVRWVRQNCSLYHSTNTFVSQCQLKNGLLVVVLAPYHWCQNPSNWLSTCPISRRAQIQWMWICWYQYIAYYHMSHFPCTEVSPYRRWTFKSHSRKKLGPYQSNADLREWLILSISLNSCTLIYYK